MAITSQREAALQLFGVVGFLFAQPLYGLLGRHPPYFVAHGSTRIDLIAFAMCISLLLPAILSLGIAPLRWLSIRLWWWAFLGLLAACAGCFAALRIIALGWMADASGGWVVAASLASGVAIVAAYARWETLQRFVSFVSPAAIVFPLLLLLYSPVSKFVLPAPDLSSASPAPVLASPVVLFIVDELPLDSLLDEEGFIDSARYPNFARLAGGSTWYRNAFSSATYTDQAVPAILTGNVETTSLPRTWLKNPQNLFTLFGRGKEIVGFETVTRLCTPRICPDRMIPETFEIRLLNLLSDTRIVALHMVLPADLRRSLPPINGAWRRFGRRHRGFGVKETERFILADEEVAHPEKWQQLRLRSNGGQRRLMRFMQLIHDGLESDVYFFHLNLPHGPWLYFPSGKEYGPAGFLSHGVQPITQTWIGEKFQLEQAAQRYLSQLQYVDHLVGLVLDELQHTGLYDRSILLLLADHGVSFREGQHVRAATEQSWTDVLSIPFMLKLPGQSKGNVDDRITSGLDVLPTLADLLDIEIPWEVEGRSLLRGDLPERSSIEAIQVVADGWKIGGLKRELPRLSFAPDSISSERAERSQFFRSLFRPGRESDGPFAFGPYQEIHGTRIDALEHGPPLDAIAYSRTLAALEEIDRDQVILPGLFEGRFDAKAEVDSNTALGIVLNGMVVSTTWTFMEPFGPHRFSSLLPERALVPGRNEVELWQIEPGTTGPVVRRIRLVPERS
jgi:hypothetical protein